MPYVLLAIAAAIAIGFVLWILLASFLRVLAFLVLYWAASFAGGILTGIVNGLVIPLRVLSGRATAKPVIATPQDVVANKVMATKARGAAKNFGWDPAWPVYNPYQAKNDALAVIAETRLMINAVWARITPGGMEAWGVTAWIAFAAVPIAGAFLGIWISIAFWLAAMALFGGTVYLGQQAWVISYRWFDRLSRKKDRASLRCNKCYRESTLPSYRCPNPGCSAIHRDISPGPLGMMRRRCQCGAGLPTTVSAAAKKLQAVCPYCDEGVAEGSATRRTIQLPTIGAIAAGKTRFLAAATVTLKRGLMEQGGTFEPLTAQAGEFLQMAQILMNTGQSTAKTKENDHPEALPYKIEIGPRCLELHFVDAAGESFRNMDTTQSLGYIDTADVMLLVVDPLGLPGIYEEATRVGLNRRLDIATADQEDAYASVIDRLRAENVKLDRRHLGVVITKLDVLRDLPSSSGMTPGDSLGVRQWLINVGQDGLVRRLEDDFGDNITYFGVDLMHNRPVTDPMHPIHVCQWVLDTSNTKIVVDPTQLTAAANPT